MAMFILYRKRVTQNLSHPLILSGFGLVGLPERYILTSLAVAVP
jgi:hypothetical protein